MPGREASGHAEVVAGSDVNRKTLEDWGKAFGVTRLVDEWTDLLRDPEIDIIDSCTPNMPSSQLLPIAQADANVARRLDPRVIKRHEFHLAHYVGQGHRFGAIAARRHHHAKDALVDQVGAGGA